MPVHKTSYYLFLELNKLFKQLATLKYLFRKRKKSQFTLHHKINVSYLLEGKLFEAK